MIFEQQLQLQIKSLIPNNIINGMKLKKILNNNLLLKNKLNDLLILYPCFYSITNIVWSILNNFDIELYKCKNCNKQLILKNRHNKLLFVVINI